MGLVIWLLLVAAAGALYFLPTFIASMLHSTNVTGVALVNTLTGWTFLGWIAALIMACVSQRRPPLSYQLPPGPPSSVYARPSNPAPLPDNRGPGSQYPAPAQISGPPAAAAWPGTGSVSGTWLPRTGTEGQQLSPDYLQPGRRMLPSAPLTTDTTA